MIESGTLIGYCELQDLARVAPDIINELSDNSGVYIFHSFRRMNKILSNLGFPVPIGTSSDGLFDPDLIDWNAYESAYMIFSANHLGEYGEEPDWITNLRTRYQIIATRIIKGEVPLQDGNVPRFGIGTSVYGSSNLGSAQFFNNSDGYFGPYSGTDFKRQFVIQIDGTGTDNQINGASFKWSRDGGYSWDATAQLCNTNWDGTLGKLVDNVFVRWENTGSGTLGQLFINDKWTFYTYPTHLERFQRRSKKTKRNLIG